MPSQSTLHNRLTPSSGQPRPPFGQRLSGLAIATLLLLLYVPLLLHWINGWLYKTISIEHEYYSHGLIGLPFAAYLVWRNRHDWRALPDRGHWLGLGLMTLAVVMYRSSLSDLINLSLPVMLAGLCLWLKGWAGLRLQIMPFLLVGLATPTQLPYLITPYTLPLQQFIAAAAGVLLMQFGLDVQVHEIYLYINHQMVEVAPYCAGLKMLFTSFYLGLLLLYWTGAWTSRTKIILFGIGIFGVNTTANILRNALLTYFHGTGQQAAFDWLHQGWGGDVYSAVMLGLLILLLEGIERLVVALNWTEAEDA